MRIVWSDSNNKTDPAPKLNALENYIERSRIKGIEKAYDEAIKEYLEHYNNLNDKNSKLQSKIKNLEQQLEVWKKNQNGRKKILSENHITFIHSEKLKGTSNRQIAKLLHVSEGTIRNYIKKSEF